jgi:hypothetical protein
MKDQLIGEIIETMNSNCAFNSLEIGKNFKKLYQDYEQKTENLQEINLTESFNE